MFTKYYQAFVDKDIRYDGVFFVGVKTTSIFCRPSCAARKPKFENCVFFTKVEEALTAFYRPCKRCNPLEHPHQISELVQILMDAVEKNPDKRWTGDDLQELSIDPLTARRHFKKRFGITFAAYARSRRMGLAMKHMSRGESVITTQLSSGYESSSGFRDAFSRIMGKAPTKMHDKILSASWLDTPLGPMLTIADETSLYLLEFVDRRGLEEEIERLRRKLKVVIIPGRTQPIESIEQELKLYFEGSLRSFKTPLFIMGSPFQKLVWEQLQKIPLGETRSYSDIANALCRPTAFRAVAQANATNQIAIVIPCHRVINANKELGGYAGGIAKKKWLLEHEKGMSHGC